jgi:hypothetical protein
MSGSVNRSQMFIPLFLVVIHKLLQTIKWGQMKLNFNKITWLSREKVSSDPTYSNVSTDTTTSKLSSSKQKESINFS